MRSRSLPVLALTVALAAAMPTTARADLAADLGLRLRPRTELDLLAASPTLDASATFLAMELESHLDRDWAVAELAVGLAGAAYSGWVLAGTIASDAGQPIPVSSWTAGVTMALNLRLATHGALGCLLWRGGRGDLQAFLPSIDISPTQGGAMLSLGWVI